MGKLASRMAAGVQSRAIRVVEDGGDTYLSEAAGTEKLLSLFGSATIAGPKIDPESVQRMIAVSACTTLKVNSARGIPMRVYQEDDQGFKDYAKGRKSPYFELVHDQPNPEQLADELWATVIGFLTSRGNGFVWKERYPTGPRSGLLRYLWALDPRRMEVKRENGRKVYRLYPDANRGGAPVTVPPEDLLHIKAAPFSPDGLVGLSRISQCREELATHAGVREFLAHHIGNGANISGFISVDTMTENGKVKPIEVPEEEADRIEAGIVRPLRGIRGSQRIPVVSAPLKWNRVGMTLADQQFMDLMAFGIADVAMLMGVPPTLVNAPVRGSSLTYRTTAEEDQRFLKYGLNPELTATQNAVAADPDLFRGSAFSPEFLREALLAMNIEARYRAHNLASRWKTVNEIRREENQPPIDGGDVLLPPKATQRFMEFVAENGPNGNGRSHAHA